MKVDYPFKAKAESLILVVISGYVRVFVCARILMADIESQCMIVSPCLSCVYIRYFKTSIYILALKLLL